MERILKKIRDRFRVDVYKRKRKMGRIYISIGSENVYSLIKYIFKNFECRLATMSAIDIRDKIRINYHIGFDKKHTIMTVRTEVRKSNPELKSIVPVIEAANWIEREIMELFGVKFLGHPKPEHLVLPEDWKEGVFPYRKDACGIGDLEEV